VVFIEDAFRIFAQRGGLSKSSKQRIYKDGFFIGTGLFGGILLNDMWRLLNLPGNYSQTSVGTPEGPQIKDEHIDEIIQYGIVGAILIASIVTGKYVKEVIPASAGAFIGIRWGNSSERKQYIGFL
jgi:hypothetical protein